MGIKIIKTEEPIFVYYPLPKDAPDVKIYYRKLNDKKIMEMRQRFGKTIFNKVTGKNEFEIIDTEGFGQFMLEKILVRCEGFFHEDETPVTDIAELYEYLKGEAWMLGEIMTRAFGASPEATVENLLVVKRMEDSAKNFSSGG